MPEKDQPVSDVQETLIQLLIEQNQLLRQLVERESASDDSHSALVPEPEYTRKEWWDMNELQSRWNNENVLKSANRLFDWVRYYLCIKGRSKGLDRESYESRGDAQLERLSELFSPINRDLEKRIMLSRCNSTEYYHPQTEDGKLPSTGSVWFVLLIVPCGVLKPSNATTRLIENYRTDLGSSCVFMDFRVAAAVMCPLLEPSGMRSHDSPLQNLLFAYIMEDKFRGRIASGADFLVEHSAGKVRNPACEGLFCRLRMRSFAAQNRDYWITKFKEKEETLSFRRHFIDELHMRERRRCLGLLQFPAKPMSMTGELLPNNDYLIVQLVDKYDRVFIKREEYLAPPGPLRLCQPGTGLAMFQRVIWAEIDNWAADWRGSLDAVDKKFAFQV